VISGEALEGPVSITDVEIFADGGTLAIVFTDVTGADLQVYADGRLTKDYSGKDVKKKLEEPRYFTVGGPITMPTSKRLDIGGRDEHELFRLLNDCIAQASAPGAVLVHRKQEYKIYKSDLGLDRQWVMGFRARLQTHLQVVDEGGSHSR